MQRFSELDHGTIFYHESAEPAFNDGYECRMQKIGPGLAVDFRHGTRQKVDDGSAVVVTGHTDVSPDQVTEVERVALTLLAQARPHHPCLSVWRLALVSDPEEFRCLDDYCLDAEPDMGDWDDEKLQAAGFALPQRFQAFGDGPEPLRLRLLEDGGVDDWAKQYGPPNQAEQHAFRRNDRAILILAPRCS